MIDKNEIELLIKRIDKFKKRLVDMQFIHNILENHHIIVREDERSTRIIEHAVFDITKDGKFLKAEGFIMEDEMTPKELSYKQAVTSCLKIELLYLKECQAELKEFIPNIELHLKSLEKIKNNLEVWGL